MRLAKTIQDVAELLSDFQVDVLLTEPCRIEFMFPAKEEEREYDKALLFRKKLMMQVDLSKVDEGQKSYFESYNFSHKVRFTVRALACSPRFQRLTTVADQLGTFCLAGECKHRYGVIKLRKRKDENLNMTFEDDKYAQIFMNDLQYTGLLKEIPKGEVICQK